MHSLFAIYFIVGFFFATLVAMLAHRQRISMSSDTYNLNTGAVPWFISCLLTWPVVLPAFFVKRQAVLRLRKGVSPPQMPFLPTVPKMSYCIVWASLWWCIAIPLYLVFFAPTFVAEKNGLITSTFVACSVLLGIPLGFVSGVLDWWWNRKPVFSIWRKRWYNQAGMGAVFCGSAAGCVLGLTEILPKVTSWEGPYGGAVAGGFLGIAIGVVYKYSAIYFRFVVEA